MSAVSGDIKQHIRFIPAAGAAVISGVIVLNDNVRRYGQLLLPGLVSTAVRFLLYAAVLYVVLHLLSKAATRQTDGAAEVSDRRKRIRTAGMFFLVYLIYLLIFYPGVMYWDTMRQINDFFDGFTTGPYFAVYDTEISALFNDHDGVFDTILFGLFISIGNLFHSPNLGMFLYCLIQAALFALLFSHIVCTVRRAGCPRWLCVAATLFYLHPFVCFYAIMMLKDVIFALAFVPYYLVFVRVAGGDTAKKNLFLLVALSLLCALTKKPGVYIVVISNAVLTAYVLLCAKKKKPERRETHVTAGMALSFVLPAFLVLYLLPKVVYPALQIYPGGREEAISVCLQTTVELIVQDEDALSEEDKAVIDRVMHYDKLADSYLSHTTDWAKYYFRSDATDEDLKEYLRFWIRKGLENPFLYLRTVAAVNGGFFSPTEVLELYISANALSPEEDYPGLGNHPATLTLREDLVRMYDILSETPPFCFFFYNVLYTWLIPAGVAVVFFAHGRRRELISLIPVLISILVLIAGPESTTRFAVHLIFLSPYLLSMTVMHEQNSKER